MQQRRIGPVQVGAIGLGAMPLSTKPDRPSPADADSVAEALRAGGAREWQIELTRDLLTAAIAAG